MNEGSVEGAARQVRACAALWVAHLRAQRSAWGARHGELLGSSAMSEFDIHALTQQAQLLKERMEYMQKGLAATEVEGSAGAGMVKAIATADQKLVSIVIDPAVPLGTSTEDREMLQDLVVAAVNNALDRAREVAMERMGSMLPPGMLPGGFPGV